MMIIYEVNLTIADSIYSAYLSWLKPHIQEMLAFPGFKEAILLKEIRQDDGYHHLTIHYQIEAIKYLHEYFDHHAETMRGKGLAQFQEGFTATRRILTIL